MIMIIFLLIIVFGLAAFFFVLLKEQKEERGALTATLNEKVMPVLPKADILLPDMPAASDPAASSLKNGNRDSKETLIDKLDQKCLKLEQILDEKNQALAKFQEDLQSEQSHRREFENFKDILQQQIEDLKLQNKKLKDDLARILQDNLQMHAEGESSKTAVQEPSPEVVVASDPVSFSSSPSRPQLIDIFEPEKK